MKNQIRLRFAPSPTGPLHIGGLRTALFNYLFAKKMGGELVLRIEDTDKKRTVKKSQKHIEESLSWLGIDFDESTSKGGDYGPYNQSERGSIYIKYANELIEKGLAYYAFDTTEALELERKGHEKKGKTFIYNSHNREKGRLVNSLVLSEKETQEKIKKGQYVIRFKTPADKVIHFEDIVRGKISVSTRDIDDKILFKSDGMPTYHLANVVDDHLMKISHVIRGEEWLPSLALHNLIYNAFGWTPPKFAHLPLILKPTGKGKLSKRDGDQFGFPVYAINWLEEKLYKGFKESGFLASALINYMAFLGWRPKGDNEVYSMSELITDFSLDNINKAGAKFDPKKLLWVNAQHIQKTNIKDLIELCFSKNTDIEKDVFDRFLEIVRPRLETIDGLKKKFIYLFERPGINKDLVNKMSSKETISAINDFITEVKSNKTNKAQNLKEVLSRSVERSGAKFGKTLGFCRASIVGKMEGPDVFEMMEFIGSEETLDRLTLCVNI